MRESSFNHQTLGDLMDALAIQVTTGFPFGGHNSNGDGETHIRPFNVGTDGAIHLEQIKSIPIEAAFEKPRLQKGDIVFNNTNTKELAGKCALWSSDERFVFSNHMTRIRSLKNSVDPAYLNFAIFHHWATGKSEMLARSHVAQASIIGARFREIEIPWPKVAEQKSIGQLLSQVQKARRTESSQQKQARKLKAETMNQLFTCGLRGAVLKETEIGLMPESWDVDRLRTHHSVVSGGTPSRSNLEFWSGGIIPWAKTTEVNYCVISQTEEHITPEGLSGSAAKLLPVGTLLLAMYGQGVTRGRVALLGIEAACNQACAAITPKDSAVVTKYLYHFLTWRYEAIRELAHGGQQQNLNLDIVRDLQIAYPIDSDEQQEIIEILDAIDTKIALHQQKEYVLDEIFRSLLNKLMTGEISVEDMDVSALTPKESQSKIEAKVQS